MRKILVVVLACAISSPILSAAGAPAQSQPAASLTGVASNSSGTAVVNATVRLRDLGTGQLAGTTTSGVNGQFSFLNLNPGNYAVEVVNSAGQIIGTSSSVAVTAGATVTGVLVSIPAAAAAAAGGAAAGAGAAAAGSSGLTSALIISTVAGLAGVAGIVAATRPASPSN